MEKRSVKQAAAATESISLTEMFAKELETAIETANWGEVCKLVERSFFDPQISDQTDCPKIGRAHV